MANHYEPPQQSGLGQFIDVLVLIVLTIGALYLPLWLGLAGAQKVPNPVTDPTWETLGQNAVAQERWVQLGYADPAAAHDIITSRFDYSFEIWQLLVMAVVVIGYFVMIVRLSDKEYREVIAERFGDKR